MEEQKERVKVVTHLEKKKRQENIKGLGRKFWYTTEFHDLAQSDQVHSQAALVPITSFKANHYVGGCVTCKVLTNL